MVVIAYYAAAHLGYALRFAGPVASIVWLPAGVGIAALYLSGASLWPAVVIGDLLVNNYSTLPVGAAVGQTVGNLLEVVIASLLLRRIARRRPPLGSIGGLVGMLLGIGAGTTVSATIGLSSLLLGHVVVLSAVPRLWRTWWLGDACGALIVLPFAFAWLSPHFGPWLNGRIIELALVLGALIGLSTLAWQFGHPLSYLALPALTWAALRFGLRGGTLAIVIGASFTVWATTHYRGPFAFQSVDRSVLETQLYLALSTFSTLAVAVLAHEREQLAEGLRASRARLVGVADDERRRIERNIHDGAQQRLVALAAHLGIAAEAARADPDTAAASFESARSELMVAVDELRELVHGIRPPGLRRFGLSRSIELAAARARTPVRLGDLPHQRLDEALEATAYYVVLEAMTNADRYAEASVIHVHARLFSGRLQLEIEDNGVGGAIEQDKLGLQGLRDRVEAVGGRFAVESAPGGGTRITADLPAATGHSSGSQS